MTITGALITFWSMYRNIDLMPGYRQCLILPSTDYYEVLEYEESCIGNKLQKHKDGYFQLFGASGIIDVVNEQAIIKTNFLKGRKYNNLVVSNKASIEVCNEVWYNSSLVPYQNTLRDFDTGGICW